MRKKIALGKQRVGRLDATMKELAQANSKKAMQKLADTQATVCVVQGDFAGQVLEMSYRNKTDAYLGRLLRRVKVVSLQDLKANLEQHLSDQELDYLIPLDLLVKGQPRRQPDAPEVWLALEVSGVVDRYDVDRVLGRGAGRRASALKIQGDQAPLPPVGWAEVDTSH